MVNNSFGMIMNAAAAVVACNVYVSAGGGGAGRNTKGILMRLLREAQDRCDVLSSSPSSDSSHPPPCSVVVHAFSDSVYDRSSFHFAGHLVHIAEIVSALATESMVLLSKNNNNDDDDKKKDIVHRHPFVGVVDHIAVMPLLSPPSANHTDTATETNEDDDDIPEVSFGLDTNPTGWTARKIGETLIQKKDDSSLCPTEVYYYGDAHPAKRSLADCRRRYTNFFRSGGLAAADDDETAKTNIVMVGAPPHFVENYNFRLSNAASKAQARALTRFLRERDGGLPGVEALTLPYSNDRHEVACNLLMPRTSSAKHIDQKLIEWTTQQQQQQPDAQNGMPSSPSSSLIEAAYRVGTTEQQCLQILEQINNEESPGSSRKRHDKTVLERFQTYL